MDYSLPNNPNYCAYQLVHQLVWEPNDALVLAKLRKHDNGS
jgi:hypothetical protein